MNNCNLLLKSQIKTQQIILNITNKTEEINSSSTLSGTVKGKTVKNIFRSGIYLVEAESSTKYFIQQ